LLLEKGKLNLSQAAIALYDLHKMLYTASYFEPVHHHGKKVAISRSSPKEFKADSQLDFLAPSAELLVDWKNKKIDEAEYTERYRGQIKQSWKQVKAWLDSLNPKEDITLLCWEKTGFCHRNLVAKLVKHYRPDCFRGCDVVRVEIDKCDPLWGCASLSLRQQPMSRS